MSSPAPTIIWPLATESRSHLPTREAAHHLSRTRYTLRVWACSGTGPITPTRVNGRLAWPVAALRELCGVAA